MTFFLFCHISESKILVDFSLANRFHIGGTLGFIVVATLCTITEIFIRNSKSNIIQMIVPWKVSVLVITLLQVFGGIFHSFIFMWIFFLMDVETTGLFIFGPTNVQIFIACLIGGIAISITGLLIAAIYFKASPRF